jgi:cytochrome c oxidase assembly factor 5
MMQYTEENEKLSDKSACAGARADLKMCLLQSDCCKIVSAPLLVRL